MAKSQTPKAAVKVEVPAPINPDGIRPVYANNAGAAATMTDVQLIFTLISQKIGPDGGHGPENNVVSMVTLPVAQVQQLIQSLTIVLANHQRQTEAFMKQMEKQLTSPKN